MAGVVYMVILVDHLKASCIESYESGRNRIKSKVTLYYPLHYVASSCHQISQVSHYHFKHSSQFHGYNTGLLQVDSIFSLEIVLLKLSNPHLHWLRQHFSHLGHGVGIAQK